MGIKSILSRMRKTINSKEDTTQEHTGADTCTHTHGHTQTHTHTYPTL